MSNPNSDNREAERRANYAAGLRALADLIEHSDLPMPHGRVEVLAYSHAADDEAGIAAVEKIAAQLGVDVQRNQRDTHIKASLTLPGGATYQYTHVVRDERARVAAVTSYINNIRPDLAGQEASR